MRRLLAALAVVLLPAVSCGGPALAAPRDFSNVIVKNVASGGWIEFNGLHNQVTAGFTPASMYQNDCGSYFVDGSWRQACEWHNASGYCMDASASDGLTYAETCTAGYHQELWITDNGPIGPNNPGYWFLNVYWSQHDGAFRFLTQIRSSVPSALSSDTGAGSGNFAVWHVGS